MRRRSAAADVLKRQRDPKRADAALAVFGETAASGKGNNTGSRRIGARAGHVGEISDTLHRASATTRRCRRVGGAQLRLPKVLTRRIGHELATSASTLDIEAAFKDERGRRLLSRAAPSEISERLGGI